MDARTRRAELDADVEGVAAGVAVLAPNPRRARSSSCLRVRPLPSHPRQSGGRTAMWRERVTLVVVLRRRRAGVSVAIQPDLLYTPG